MALQNCALNLNRTGRESCSPMGRRTFPVQDILLRVQTVPGCGSWHWHEDLEIIYVESGHLRLQVPVKPFI